VGLVFPHPARWIGAYERARTAPVETTNAPGPLAVAEAFFVFLVEAEAV